MPLAPFADGVWTDSDPVTILGMPLRSTMTVLRLEHGRLLVCSPVALTEERHAGVDALGTVAHLYAPNLYHHRWIGEWAAAYPAARLHAPQGLRKKRPDLRIDRHHDRDPEPAFAPLVEELRIEGFRLRESVLLYRPARVLVVTDLVQNVGRPEHAWTKLYTRAMGFYDRVALSRIIRWTAFADRRAARASLEALLEREFDALVVGHGTALRTGGKEALRDAFRWLV